MRGIGFDALERVVLERYGEDRFEELLDAVGHRLETTEPFIGPAVYPDEDFVLLIDELARQTGDDREMLARAVGARAFDLLAARHREIVAGQRDLRALIATLERGRLTAPELRLFRSGDGFRAELVAPEPICAVAEGLLQAAAAHFHETVAARQVSCIAAGDRLCAWELAAA